jgi:prepilin-type N-terminal cleavage/methylation domain-containing protein
MAIHRRSPLPPRPAFTMVELIVVIAIVLALAALIVLIFPRLQDSQRVAKGADILQGQLYLAKQMAMRDQQPRGVRLLPGNGGYTSLQLIEQPLAYSIGQATGIQQNSTNPNYFDVLFSTTQSPAPNFGNSTVQQGDYLDLSAALDGYTTGSYPHAMHVIVAPPTVSGNNWVLTVATPPWTSQLPNTVVPNPTMTSLPWNYRVVRSPRAMVAQQPVLFPEDVAISSGPGNQPPTSAAGAPYDIMFDPSGVVLGGTPGKVIFWLYDPTGGTPEQALVAVYSRAGNIIGQPIAPGSDPYLFIKDGSTSGM